MNLRRGLVQRAAPARPFYGWVVVAATMDRMSRNSPYFLAQCRIMSRFEFNHPAVRG